MFDKYAKENSILKKKNNEIWLAYCGTIGRSYDLSVVIDALKILKNEKIRFIVMGDGPQIDEYKAYANEKRINATFVGRLPYNQMCSLLTACDITINPIMHKAAQSIINKHADYSASGLPVVSTQENDEYRCLVDEYKMGFNCKNGDVEDLAAKINLLVEDKELRSRMGKNSRRCAEEQFDRNNSYKLVEEKILASCRGGEPCKVNTVLRD